MQILPLISLAEPAQGSDQSKTLIKKTTLSLSRQLQKDIIFCRI